MSEWWDRYLFDDLIGLEAAAVASDGSRHIGPFVRFGDYLTVDDTCVFTRKDKGDGVRLMEEVDHVRLRPEEPFWQGRFLDELEGVRVRVEFGGRRGAFEGPLEPFDGVLGIRAGGRGLEYVFGDSGYRFAQPGFVRVRPVEDQPDEPVPAINASGKTTALRVTELALAVAGGMSLGSLNPDLFPLYDTMDDRIGVRALFEQDGRFHLIDSLLERTGEGRTPLRFIRETLSIHHGKLSKKMLASAMNGTLDPERWTVLSSRNVGRPGVRSELSADAKRYLPPDRSICGAFVKDTDIATELLPVSPTLTVSPARPVVTLFDASIERLDYDKDGIHLKFRNEGKEREVTPNSLVNMVSSGTLRGGALVGRALETLRAGGYLIVDELENSINKQLVFAIMDLFASPVTNPHGATLLFSTHYPELLDHFTRKDSIWFAVRDGKGFALRNLGAYLGRTDLKKSVSFFANRVPGTAPSYAAVRALQDYAERYVHA